MDEDRKGYENFKMVSLLTVLKVNYVVMKTVEYRPIFASFVAVLTHMATGVRYSNVHYKSKDNYLTTIVGRPITIKFYLLLL